MLHTFLCSLLVRHAVAAPLQPREVFLRRQQGLLFLI